MNDWLARAKFLGFAVRGRAVVGMDEIQERPRQQLLDAPAESFRERGIETLEITVRVGNAQQVQGEPKERVAFRFRLRLGRRFHIRLRSFCRICISAGCAAFLEVSRARKPAKAYN